MPADPFSPGEVTSHLNIGMLIYDQMDQIDFTGPFEVFSRMENASVYVIGKEKSPVRDCQGLILTPDTALAQAPSLDLLQIPGGPAAGLDPLVSDEAILGCIRGQISSGRYLYSVCTGALLCSAAGILRGRRVTTHWAAFDLLPYFGAVPVDARVVVDGNLVSAAGITAGIDGALTIVAMLRGVTAAQRIQLAIEYAPEPPFHAGSPKTAPPEIVEAVTARYRAITEARLAVARRFAGRPGSLKS